jgi:hypothetical protein
MFVTTGAKVTVACKDNNGNVVDSVQGSTDFLGNFLVTFKGKQDLSGCTVSLAGSSRSDCNIAGGGGKTLTLKSRLLFEALYVVDPLFYQPAKPLDFCPKNSSPAPSTPSGSITVPFPNRHPSTCSPRYVIPPEDQSRQIVSSIVMYCFACSLLLALPFKVETL